MNFNTRLLRVEDTQKTRWRHVEVETEDRQEMRCIKHFFSARVLVA